MNPNLPNSPEPKKDGEFDRRLEKLSKPSEVSGVSKDAEQLPNLPAQKIITVISSLNAAQVTAAKLQAREHAAMTAVLSEIKEQMVTKELAVTLSQGRQDDLAAVNARLARIDAMQADLGYRILVAMVALGTMILALGIAVAFVVGGHR